MNPWLKHGQIWAPDGSLDWGLSHAANPIAEPLGGDRYRVYVAMRDAQQRSHVGAVEFALTPPYAVDRVEMNPVLAPGPIGAFDDSGVVPACLIEVEGRSFLYYLGWNLGRTVPWRNSIGLAIREPGSSMFQRVSPAPILDRNFHDPFSISYPWVMPRPGGGWRMWYGSNLHWGARAEDMAHVIKYAVSDDAISWQPTGQIAIGFGSADEYAIARPCVRATGRGLAMWYSYRGAAYRIGYAESHDGLAWRRLDQQVGIMPSTDGWDAGSIQYACVFAHGDREYMLYNGKDYGRTGFGLAVRERGPASLTQY